jgi:hypothetical protein
MCLATPFTAPGRPSWADFRVVNNCVEADGSTQAVFFNLIKEICDGNCKESAGQEGRTR